MSSIYGSLVLFSVFSFESTLGSTSEFTGILACILLQITVFPCVGTIAVARLAASYRYAVMLSLLWLILLIPIVVSLCHLSGWRLTIPVVGQLQPSQPVSQTEPILSEGPIATRSQPVLTEVAEADDAAMGTGASTLTTNRVVAVGNSKSEATTNPSLPTVRLRWYHVLFLLWAVGVVLSLGRFIYGILVVRSLLRASQRLEVPLSVATQLQTVFRMKDLPDLREVVDLPVPIMTGIRKPVIVVPKGLADQWRLRWECERQRDSHLGFRIEALLHRLQCDNAQPGMVALSKDERLLATSSRQEISVWDLKTGIRIAADFVGHNASLSCLHCSETGLRVFATIDRSPQQTLPRRKVF